MAKTRKILSFEEAYNNAMQFCDSFGMLTKLMPQVSSELDKKDKLNAEEIIETSCNFVLGVGHKKCGCPGFVAMIFHDNCWVCPRCNGWMSKNEAKKVMKKDYNKIPDMFKQRI